MPHTYTPFADTPAIDSLAQDLRMNISDRERIGSGIVGTALVGAGLARTGLTRWLFLLAGAALLRRGWTGHCAALDFVSVDHRHGSRGVPGNRGSKVEHSIEINRSPEVLYNFWANLEQLPKVMRHVKSVRRLGNRRSHWTVDAPLGQTVSWEAEIISEEPGRHLAWQSLPNSTVGNAGSVWFEPAPGGGTQLRVTFQYDPPAGALGSTIAALLGNSPQQDLEADLAAFKAYAERELEPFATA